MNDDNVDKTITYSFPKHTGLVVEWEEGSSIFTILDTVISDTSYTFDDPDFLDSLINVLMVIRDGMPAREDA